jgi:leucyl-tRNA synthetase
MFMGPFDQGGPWNDQGIEGVSRYLNRVWTLVTDFAEARGEAAASATPAGREVDRLRHKTIARITADYEGLRFNTALAALMEFVNGLNKAREATPDVQRDPRYAAAVETLLTLLAPMAPHIAEELWSRVGHAESVHRQPWPDFDPALTQDEQITVVIQVNGKVRDTLLCSPDVTEAQVREAALASGKVGAALGGREVRKFIYVPGKLANLVG